MGSHYIKGVAQGCGSLVDEYTKYDEC